MHEVSWASIVSLYANNQVNAELAAEKVHGEVSCVLSDLKDGLL